MQREELASALFLPLLKHGHANRAHKTLGAAPGVAAKLESGGCHQRRSLAHSLQAAGAPSPAEVSRKWPSGQLRQPCRGSQASQPSSEQGAHSVRG